jgi:hypothetical protein
VADLGRATPSICSSLNFRQGQDDVNTIAHGATTSVANNGKAAGPNERAALEAAPLVQLSHAVLALAVGSTYGNSRTGSRQEIDRNDVGHVVDRGKVERWEAGEHRGDAECAALACINVELSDEFT